MDVENSGVPRVRHDLGSTCAKIELSFLHVRIKSPSEKGYTRRKMTNSLVSS